MGYYIQASGTIDFKVVLSKEDSDKILDKIANLSFHGQIYNNEHPTYDSADVLYDGKYDEQDFIEVLNFISKIAPVESGEIECYGEDYARWRFYYKNGEWIQQAGEVLYSDKNLTQEDVLKVIQKLTNLHRGNSVMLNTILYFGAELLSTSTNAVSDMLENMQDIYIHT